MYYLAKFFELVGITVIPIAFFFNWPEPMRETTLLYAVIFFMAGWIIEKLAQHQDPLLSLLGLTLLVISLTSE